MKVKVLKRESADYLRESKHEIHKVNKVALITRIIIYNGHLRMSLVVAGR